MNLKYLLSVPAGDSPLMIFRIELEL